MAKVIVGHEKVLIANASPGHRDQARLAPTRQCWSVVPSYTMTNSPDEMPTEWQVRDFSHERGLGTLVHPPTGTEIPFAIDAWTVGDWEPPAKEAAVMGAKSPYMPQAGEPVRVEWKRSATGKTVPRSIQPTGRVAAPPPVVHSLAEWLAAVQTYAGKLLRVTSAGLLEALGNVDGDAMDHFGDGEARDASEYGWLLFYLGGVHEVDPAWAEQNASWIFVDDHRWDRRRASREICAALGLAPSAVAPNGDSESLAEYVARCNARAREHASREIFHAVPVDGDAFVFVLMTEEGFSALVANGFIEAEVG